MYFPLCFKTDNLRCLVVGGGEVAARKIRQMIKAGCEVTVIAPEICDEVLDSRNLSNLTIEKREFRDGNCKGCQLVIAATADRNLNRRIFGEAKNLGIPVNVVDDPDLCTVVFSAIWRDDPLSIAVSTGGTAPFLAAEIRNRLGEAAEGYGDWVRIGGRFRKLLMDSVNDPERRKRLMKRFVMAGPPGVSILPPNSNDLDDWIDWLEKISAS